MGKRRRAWRDEALHAGAQTEGTGRTVAHTRKRLGALACARKRQGALARAQKRLGALACAQMGETAWDARAKGR